MIFLCIDNTQQKKNYCSVFLEMKVFYRLPLHDKKFRKRHRLKLEKKKKSQKRKEFFSDTLQGVYKI